MKFLGVLVCPLSGNLLHDKVNEVYDTKSRQTCLEIAKKYLSGTYSEECQEQIMRCLTDSSTQVITLAICADKKMVKLIKKGIKAQFTPMTIPVNGKFVIAKISFTVKNVEQHKEARMGTIKEGEEQKEDEAKWWIPCSVAA